MTDKEYIPRLIDKKVDDYLSVCGAVCIEGPKWCGKTLTSLNHANSVIYMDDEDTRMRALLEVDSVFYHDDKMRPELIDEWHLVPEIWDAVRRKVDNSRTKGNFILTSSTTLHKKNDVDKINHFGTGRIAKLKMYTMSLYESGDSSGMASLSKMFDGTQESMNTGEVLLDDLVKLIIRGGWPENLGVADDKIHLIPKLYINSILDSDMNDDDKKRDRNKMLFILRSLARNESTIVSNNTLLNDTDDSYSESDLVSSRDTLRDYIGVLDRLHLIENQDAFSINFRSSSRVGKSPKRHLTDPSLACACLNLNAQKLLSDLNTLGFMFEAMVERDLRIYADYLDGRLYHFRDNTTGLVVDSIIEFASGDYCAIEIKLGINQVDVAKENLMKFYNFVSKKPKFMCIIVGKTSGIVRDKETGIYIVPITALMP